MKSQTPKIHNRVEFNSMRLVGRLAADILDFIEPYVIPGKTTNELNELCHQFTLAARAKSAPLGYQGFPKSICTSVNSIVCHGIPNDEPLKDGDIINIDVTPQLNGWHGDSSRTFIVGNGNKEAQDLCDITKAAMMFGIQMAYPGNHVGDIGWAIEHFAKNNGYHVIRDFGGHGIGKIFHDAPIIPNYGYPKTGIKLQAGMFITVEPILTKGSTEIMMLDDGWTIDLVDRSLSAQFEHTIGITEDGPEIFTLSSKERNYNKIMKSII